MHIEPTVISNKSTRGLVDSRKGADSEEVHQALKQSDRLLAHLLETVKALGLEPTTNIIVVGDHGMTDHSTDNVLYLDDYGVRLGELRWFTNNIFTTGMLLPHGDINDDAPVSMYQVVLSESPGVS